MMEIHIVGIPSEFDSCIEKHRSFFVIHYAPLQFICKMLPYLHAKKTE